MYRRVFSCTEKPTLQAGLALENILYNVCERVCVCIITRNCKPDGVRGGEVLELSETSDSLDKGRHCPQALIQVNFHILSYNSEVNGCDRRI